MYVSPCVCVYVWGVHKGTKRNGEKIEREREKERARERESTRANAESTPGTFDMAARAGDMERRLALLVPKVKVCVKLKQNLQ